jgi:Rod binding domain-containing protein
MQATLSAGYAVTAQGEMGKAMPSPRLTRAAHEFEGQMMEELLKPLTSDELLPGASGDSDSGGGSGGALGQFASEALGQALSAHGGFGIADRILKTVSPPGNRHQGASVTGNLHGNTVMRSPKSLK